MILSLQNIRKTFVSGASGSERHVLNNINLEIKKNDLISIVGPSGSGKSTLLNIMGTMDVPSAGRVQFKGRDTATLSANDLAVIRNSKIGFIFQQHHLLPQLTLMENVLLPLLAVKDNKQKMVAAERAKELIEWVGLADRIMQFPAQLSVGECQRAAVVRSLINEPELILADEPTGSLDEKTAFDLVTLLTRINMEKGPAIVMVTHASALADKMKTKLRLTDGNLHTEV